MTLLLRAADPPLDPSGDEARSLLGRELAHPEYHEANVLQRLLEWLDRLFNDTVNATSQSGPLTLFLASMAALLLVLALVALISRARRSPRVARAEGPVVEDRHATADELRAAAERALSTGQHAEAVVEGFRAITVRQVERGGLEDRPGATAHEVAAALAATHPDQRARVSASAQLFDAVRYGDRPASRDQASEVLALDDALAGRR